MYFVQKPMYKPDLRIWQKSAQKPLGPRVIAARHIRKKMFRTFCTDIKDDKRKRNKKVHKLQIRMNGIGKEAGNQNDHAGERESRRTDRQTRKT